MENRTGHRQSKALLIGVLTGVCLLFLLLFFSRMMSQKTQLQESFLQSNLTSGGGSAAADFQASQVSIIALLDGNPHDGMSASPDQLRWYTPEKGLVNISLTPGDYEFCASYENRSVFVHHAVTEDMAMPVVLDVDLAPEAPTLLFLEAENEKRLEFLLEISGADTASLKDPPNGVTIIRQGASFSLVADGDLLSYGFHALELLAENQYGQTVTWIGLRNSRNQEVTQVYTIEDLDQIRYNLSGSYLLMNDLDMSGTHEWQAIGNGEYPFTGVFDGGGHEITGFHFSGNMRDGIGASLFGDTKNAEIRNLIIREPMLLPETVTNESDYCSVITSSVGRGLIENCAVIGGKVAPAGGGAQGIVGANTGILLGLFNSADMICVAPKSSLQNTGGIVGNNVGYCAYLANEGEVYGTHLQAGICGWHHGGVISKSVNSGYVWGATLVGEFPPAGIVQTANDGAISAYGYFVRGQAAVGGKSFSKSIINSLFPIDEAELRNPDSLKNLGSFEGENADWAFASLDARGPIPYGIFKRQAEEPQIEANGNHVKLPHAGDMVYFYTLDGSDPRVYGGDGVESLDVTLTGDQVLTVFAARQGNRDSDIVQFDSRGGTMQ